MQQASFEGYTLPEFLREFITTLFELMLGIIQAITQIFTAMGPFAILSGIYVVLLLLAVASELKKHHRKRQSEHKAYQDEVAAYMAEKQRIQAEKDERIAGFAQRSAKKPAGKKLPASAHLTYQVQRNNTAQGSRGR